MIYAFKRNVARQQRGVSLPMVLIVLLLATIAVLGAFRVSFLNESVVGNESDHSRAFAAAEALLQDAEIDIRGRKPPYDVLQTDGSVGFPCQPLSTVDPTDLNSKIGYEYSCRLRNSTSPWFPQNSEEFDLVYDLIIAGGDANKCMNGICMPDDLSTLNTIEDQLKEGNKIGVPYGSYTRTALDGPTVAAKDGNAILETNATPLAGSAIPISSKKAWYVVEAFRYGDTVISGAHPANALKPDAARRITYRITAVALGMKPGTRVVLKSTFVPFPANQSK